MPTWKEYKLGEIAKFQEGYVNPSQTKAEYFDGPIKWLRANDVTGSVVYRTSRTITKEGFESAGKSAKLFKPNSLVITKSGTIGRLGILKDYMCGNRAIINIEPLNQECNSLFLFYSLKNNTSNIIELAEGSVQKNLYIPILKEFKIKLPDLPTQTAIAEILSSLDDKIEINSQINKELEALAQALFKQWFIDFEFPNEKVQPYKSSGGEMAESELGEIPKGWRITALSELLEVKYGKDHKHLSEGKIPVYGSGGIMRYANEALYTDHSILIPRKGTLSNLFYISKPFWSVDTMFYSIIKKEYLRKFLYYTIKLMDLASMNVGSAVPSMTTKVLNDLKLILPSQDTLIKFESTISSMFEYQDEISAENQDLATLRDSLLPKLISGELTVKDV